MNHELANRLFDLFEEAPDSRVIQTTEGLAVGSLKGPRDSNQDRVCTVNVTYGARPHDNLLIGVVCDGMGGMKEGGVAATLALSVFVSELITSRRRGAERLRDAVSEANKAVFNLYQGRGGTTLTGVVVALGGETWSIHVGDSRLYSFTGGELSLLSRDDTISGIVSRNDPDQIEDAQDNRLVQFIGIGPDLQPHLAKLVSSSDQTWLLTSDGAHGLGRNMMHKIASNARSGADIARKILFVVDAAPLGDNASVVALAPALFNAPKRYRDGISLTVWTANDHLELWIEESNGGMAAAPAPEFKADQVALKAKPRAKPKVKNKGKGGKTPRSNAGMSTGNSGPVDPDRPVPPLLNIVFGDEDAS